MRSDVPWLRVAVLAGGLAGLVLVSDPSSGQEPKAKKGIVRKKDDPKPPAPEKPTADQLAFFEKKIRPVLVSQCYACHSEEAKKEKGGLLVDTRAGLRKGGESGPALVPGSPTKSLLIKAIKQAETLKMPPKSKLDDDVVADFEKWIASGAADPRDGKAAAPAVASQIDIEKGRQNWAFQLPKASTAPIVQ